MGTHDDHEAPRGSVDDMDIETLRSFCPDGCDRRLLSVDTRRRHAASVANIHRLEFRPGIV